MFRYILVDECQDTNLVQYFWLRLLAQEHKNICCVGDDDQSIYSWRDAEVENILRFEHDSPGAKIVRLEANYRSTAPILAATVALIERNEGRFGKTLRSGRQDATRERVTVVVLWDSDEEARMAGDRIEALRRAGYMRLVVQPADDLAFERIANVPQRGVGAVALRMMHEVARADDVRLMDAVASPVASGRLKGRVKEQMDALLRGFVCWRALLDK